MERYVIESPHAAEDCDRAIRDLYAAGYLHFFEWGCKDNDHTGWAFVEAESREHALQMVPWYLRERARVVRLVKFGPADGKHRKQA
ncbi:MAG TPA: hypothetical protein VIU39_01855 [Anaerolineales bacterium]